MKIQLNEIKRIQRLAGLIKESQSYKVYIVHEISDYGLWDMSDAKIFTKFKEAEAYNEEYYNQHGHTLVITEWDVE